MKDTITRILISPGWKRLFKVIFYPWLLLCVGVAIEEGYMEQDPSGYILAILMGIVLPLVIYQGSKAFAWVIRGFLES